MTTQAEENETKRQSRSEQAIAANDAAESGGTPKAKPKPKPKPKESVGMGKNDSAAKAAAIVAKLKADMAKHRASGNIAFADKLAARIKAVQATVVK